MNSKSAAEQLKNLGNDYFRREKYGAAIEKYTEAITLCPDMPVLYVNRALCHKKRSDWEPVMYDCRTALSLSRDLLKAHYLLGIALREQQQLPEAITHLQKALEAAREKEDSMKDEIWRELAKAKYSQWQVQAAARRAEQDELRQKLHGYLLQQRRMNEQIMSAAEAAAKHEVEAAMWERLFSRAAQGDHAAEMPSPYTCSLTMETFREPAITPGGQSYERAALMEHLSKVGKWDPVTRAPLRESEVVLNLGLRAATQHYLDEHPWAWAECI